MKLTGKNNIDILQFNILEDENLFHFSTTVKGGVSEGNYATFNLGFYGGDEREKVYENRTRLALAAEIEYSRLYIPYQTHSDNITVINEEFLNLNENDRYLKLNGVDAVITNQPDICIGITTADCVPVLLYDPVKKILAAVHAGWKGTVQYIAVSTLKKMKKEFDCNYTDVKVGIGPAISAACYEVGDDVRDTFMLAAFDMEKISFLNEETGKYHIDLKEANRLQLIEAGILPDNIEVTDLCTYCQPELFFSARRQGIHSGRMVTGGVLKNI